MVLRPKLLEPQTISFRGIGLVGQANLYPQRSPEGDGLSLKCRRVLYQSKYLSELELKVFQINLNMLLSHNSSDEKASDKADLDYPSPLKT